MADSERVRIVLFRLGSALCAAPVALVREVIEAGRPTRIPGTDRTVAGLVNLRGSLLTVVDGRRAAGAADTGERPESVLVLDRGDRSFGIAVDEVVDLVDVPAEALWPDLPHEGVDSSLIEAIGEHQGRQFALLDTNALLAPVLG